MIEVTRLNRSRMILNSDLIESIENTPDTVITLINDRKITVMEAAQELVRRVQEYKRSLVCPEHSSGPPRAGQRDQTEVIE